MTEDTNEDTAAAMEAELDAEFGADSEVSIDSPEFDATCSPVPMPHYFHGSMTPRT